MAKANNKEPDVFSSVCPSREILGHVTSPWGSLILVLLLEKTHRFSELKKRIGGISEKMLAQNLRNLEKDGFVLRKDYGEMPPKVDYSLTKLGVEVATQVQALVELIRKHFPVLMTHRKKSIKKISA